MNLRLLIDGVVRQTTLLIAQLSTTAGVRSPLAHVADQVFLNLAKELEFQGISKPIAADMFGMALRSYQKKMRRLGASSSDPNRTLWQAVHEFVQDEQPTRRRVISRFARDGEREVAAVLNDLVSSGLICVSGSGPASIYSIASEAMRGAVQEASELDAQANWIWLRVFNSEVTTREQLSADGLTPSRIEAVLAELESQGRVREVDGNLVASNVVIPVGADSGVETAMLDHFRAVCQVLAAKMRKLGDGSQPAVLHQQEGNADVEPPTPDTGGSTFTFTLDARHPYRDRVQELLSETRERVQPLWQEVADYNQAHPPDEQTAYRVTYYAGQTREQNEG